MHFELFLRSLIVFTIAGNRLSVNLAEADFETHVHYTMSGWRSRANFHFWGNNLERLSIHRNGGFQPPSICLWERTQNKAQRPSAAGSRHYERPRTQAQRAAHRALKGQPSLAQDKRERQSREASPWVEKIPA